MREAVAFYRVVVYLLQISVVGTVADTLLEVYQQTCLLVFGEGVVMHTHALRCRQLSADTVIQQQRVVSWAHSLVLVPIVGGACALYVVLFATGGTHRAGERHKKDITKVGTTRAAKVCMAEANQYTVGIMISRAPVPALMNVCRSELHSPERDACSDKHVSVFTRPDVRVYIRDVVSLRIYLLRILAGGGKEQAYGDARHYPLLVTFHTLHALIVISFSFRRWRRNKGGRLRRYLC